MNRPRNLRNTEIFLQYLANLYKYFILTPDIPHRFALGIRPQHMQGQPIFCAGHPLSNLVHHVLCRQLPKWSVDRAAKCWLAQFGSLALTRDKTHILLRVTNLKSKFWLRSLGWEKELCDLRFMSQIRTRQPASDISLCLSLTHSSFSESVIISANAV